MGLKTWEENLGQLIEEAIDQHFGNQIEARYIDQCGCGGYVLRVLKQEERQ